MTRPRVRSPWCSAVSRILLVTNIFPPYIGGPATFMDRLGHALAARGHQVTVVCTSEMASDPQDSNRPFRVRRIHGAYRAVREIKTWLVLAQEFLTHSNILVNGLEYPSGQIAARLGRTYVLKIVGDKIWETARSGGHTSLSIDEFQGNLPGSPFLRRVSKERDLYLKHAAAVITPSNYLKRMVSGWGVQPSRIVTIPNGIPIGEYQRFAPRRRGFGPFRIAFCGRLMNWKGVETILLACHGMANVQVDIVGDGPEWPMLAALAHQLDLDGTVKFHGRLGQADLQDVLSFAHVLVLVSEYEGLSHTLLEACAMALPCIASDRGGNPETIEPGVQGFLVPYGDVARLRVSLEQLQVDEELRFELACNAKDGSQRFDFDGTVQRTMDVVLNS